MWGEESARSILGEAGFNGGDGNKVELIEVPWDGFNNHYYGVKM